MLKGARDPGVYKTSSSGRFLDSISALTGVCNRRTYEGEPAIKLEAAAKNGDPEKIGFDPVIDVKNGKYILKTGKVLYFLTDLLNKENIFDIMAFGQKYLASGMTQIACEVADENGIDMVVISGGVLANEYISSYIQRSLQKVKFKTLFPSELPPGDGGISLGQSMIALSSVI